MAWTNPRTWLAGTKVAAAALNTDVRDNLNWVNRDGLWCKAHLTGSPAAVPPNDDQLVPLNTVDAGEDPSGMFDVSSHLATIPVKGLYLIIGAVRFTVLGTTTVVASSLYKNVPGGGIPQFVGFNVVGSGGTSSRLLVLNAGDTIGLNCWQDSGGNLSYDLGFGSSGNHLDVVCLVKL